MICGAADEGSAALFVWGGGTDLAPAPCAKICPESAETICK